MRFQSEKFGLGTALAAAACLSVYVAHVVRRLGELAGDAGPPLALLLGALRAVGLLAFRRWQRGIVRRLGRRAEPGLQSGNARDQVGDLRGLRQHQSDQLFLVERTKQFGGHPQLESAHEFAVYRPIAASPAQTRTGGVGVSSYD